MIAQLTGAVARVAETAGYLVLDVHGVGYKVSAPVPVILSLPPIGQVLTLIIHTLVREDDISLYGFATDSDLRVFELLLTVSGVGPKVAMGLLSALSASDLATAVAADDLRTLTKVPGIGAKTAQRMVLELKEKFAALGIVRKVDSMAQVQAIPKRTDAETVGDDVVAALLNLGYSKAESQRASDSARDAALKSGGAAAIDFAFLLRSALGRLTSGK